MARCTQRCTQCSVGEVPASIRTYRARMGWATDLLRIKTKLLGLGVDDPANALGLSLMDAEAIWEVRMLPTPRQVAVWALWIGEDPYDYAGLLFHSRP